MRFSGFESLRSFTLDGIAHKGLPSGGLRQVPLIANRTNQRSSDSRNPTHRVDRQPEFVPPSAGLCSASHGLDVYHSIPLLENADSTRHNRPSRFNPANLFRRFPPRHDFDSGPTPIAVRRRHNTLAVCRRKTPTQCRPTTTTASTSM